MASKIGMTYRNEAAQARIDATLEGLTKGLTLDVGPVPTNRRDPILQETLRLEWMADLLEVLAAGPDPSKPDIDLNAMKRDDLNAYAREHGVEDPEGLPNKGAVMEAVSAAQAVAAEQSDPGVPETDTEGAEEGDPDVSGGDSVPVVTSEEEQTQELSSSTDKTPEDN